MTAFTVKGNHSSKWLTPILSIRSGTSSHTQNIARYVRHYIDVQAQDLQSLPPVESAATIMREIIYNNAGRLSASMICSGWDPYKGY